MAQPAWWGNWGWLVSVGILASIVWINYIYPAIRRLRLKKPCSAYFKTEDRSQKLTTIQIDSNKEVEIQTRVVAKLNFKEYGFVFGFKGDPHNKPLPKSIVNKFIKSGLKQTESPVDSEHQFIDYNDNYHVEFSPPRNRTRDTTYATGFVVQTRGAGKYEAFMTIFGDEVEGEISNKLYVNVVD